MADRIHIVDGIKGAMLGHAQQDSAHECCGLLAGRGGTITTFFPAQNILASPTAYEIAPPELFSIFREIRAQHLELLGIYHSHPNTENTPSPKDIARAYYPDAAYFIISPAQSARKPIRAFRIKNGIVSELQIGEIM